MGMGRVWSRPDRQMQTLNFLLDSDSESNAKGLEKMDPDPDY